MDMVVRFLFSNPREAWKQPGAWLIRRADRSKASHFAIAIFGFGTVFVYEAVFPKCRRIPYSEWINHNKIESFHDFEVPSHLQARVHEWLKAIEGRWYSVPQLLLIAVTILEPLNKLLNWAILNHEKQMICTEVGSRFVEEFTTIPMEESHDKIGVSDMYEITAEMAKNPRWRARD
jgi:hypothetical protein